MNILYKTGLKKGHASNNAYKPNQKGQNRASEKANIYDKDLLRNQILISGAMKDFWSLLAKKEHKVTDW